MVSALVFVSLLLIHLSISTESTGVSIPWRGKTVGDLEREYYNVFPARNRNAASHRWATFLLERSRNMDKDTFAEMFSGFCPVSGSVIRSPGARTLWQMTLPHAVDESHTITGGIHFCCWPCVCDTADFIRVDTKTVELKDQTYQFNFLVLGDPCEVNGTLIPRSAPDANCDDEQLIKGTKSDHGFVIIGLLQELPSTPSQVDIQVASHCEDRAIGGYRSGMGTIFREVAGINPISNQLKLEV